MVKLVRPAKYSGVIAPDDVLHQIVMPKVAPTPSAPDETYIPATLISVPITSPTQQTIQVPQYSPTVQGGSAAGYDPAGDCDGNFMSYKFQCNNNCYAYGCNISTNTFPQPGRNSGYLYPYPLTGTVAQLGKLISDYAIKDGLQWVGTSMADIMTFKSTRQGTTPPLAEAQCGALDGHFVALMVSPAGDANWGGDYHWSRCDDSSGGCSSWSQKDGGDQVTNFDFAGKPISNPSTANWTVNQGPVTGGTENGEEMVVSYEFYCFLFVPASGVAII